MTKLSLVIPVYNEARHLEQVVERVMAVDFPCPVELVMVDDASRDESWAIITRLAERFPILALRQEVNAGKGAALRRGFELASGEIIAVQDADFEYNPADLARLVRPILEDRADVVFGSRFHRGRVQVHRTFHYLVNRGLTFLSNVMSDLYLSDMETCYKVFRADIIKSLELSANRFGFEPEVTALLAKLRVRIEEHPIDYFPRSYVEGKKIGWRDGVAALWFIVKFNLEPLSAQSLARLPARYLRSSQQHGEMSGGERATRVANAIERDHRGDPR